MNTIELTENVVAWIADPVAMKNLSGFLEKLPELGEIKLKDWNYGMKGVYFEVEGVSMRWLDEKLCIRVGAQWFELGENVPAF